ncbi:MAG: hypothetical protein AABZ74_11710, partial [Cyanobacteriota bacterium]
MEENLKEINETEISSLLKQLIVEKNLVKEEIIEDLLIQRDKEVELLRSNKEEICYVIDYNKRALVVFNKNTNENIASVSLANKFKKYDHEDFQSWGTSSIIIDLDELQKDGEIEYKNDSLYGFITSENKTYLYNQNVDSLPFHALTDRVVFGGIPKIKDSLLPFDMCFSGTNQLISLSNRDLGEVMIFNTRENDFIAEIPVRDIGTSNKSLNVAMSEIKKRVYITDNETSILQTYSFNTKKINKRNFSNLGILGNICLSPDESTLYVLVLKPEPFLKTLDSETLEEKKLFPVKGDFFSLLDDPCDLLTLSPDNTHLFFMTYINEPEPFTPVISIINIEKEKTIKRFSIKDSVKPILLSFKKENPVFAANKSLETLLIEKNYLTKDKIKELILEIKKSKEENIVIENLIEVEQENLIIHQSEHEVIAPKKVKHIIISIEANKHIKDILLGVFWQKTEIDLTENIEENERLEKIANNIRIKLEYYDLEIVEFKNYFENHSLETVIQREYILQTLSEEEAKDKEKIVSSLSNCLNCSAPMYGSWDCAVCGQSYEKPEDAMRRKEASLEPLANFQKGNFFILDQEKGILIEVDKYKNPIWSISKDEIGLKSLQKIFRLDNRNTIILDKENSAIFEISSKGRDVWKYAIQENTKIEHPEGFGIIDSSDLIIADTNNHRVLEMDLDGNIIWEYGIKGNKGDTFNYLSYPKDIQKTYDGTYLITDSGNNRIIEIKRELNAEKGLYEIRLAWSFTKELKNPIQAYKELDNNILILDQGNKRLLQIDEKGNILFEFNTEIQSENHVISNPQSFLRLKNKDLLIVGDGKAIEIFQEKNIGKIIWCETIENIQQKTKIKVTKADVKIAKMKFEKTKYKGKFGKSKYKEILEKIESKLKSFGERYYMRKYGKKSFSELNNEERTKEKRMVVNVNHYIKKYGQKNPEDDDMYVIEDDKNKKIVKSNHYMRKANEVDDEIETEENNKNKVKLVNANHYMNKNNDVNEEELLDENNKNKVKLVNAAHYMNK